MRTSHLFSPLSFDRDNTRRSLLKSSMTLYPRAQATCSDHFERIQSHRDQPFD